MHPERDIILSELENGIGSDGRKMRLSDEQTEEMDMLISMYRNYPDAAHEHYFKRMDELSAENLLRDRRAWRLRRVLHLTMKKCEEVFMR